MKIAGPLSVKFGSFISCIAVPNNATEAASYFGVAQRIFLGIILSWALRVAARGLERAATPVEATVAA
jgi:hypothetical protein